MSADDETVKWWLESILPYLESPAYTREHMRNPKHVNGYWDGPQYIQYQLVDPLKKRIAELEAELDKVVDAGLFIKDKYYALLEVAKEMREWVDHTHPPEYHPNSCAACKYDEQVK